MYSLRYVVCDVFAERALAGSSLCVFTDARRLDAATMQALARETSLSETVFVLPPERGGHARLRVFTPRGELPFAAHSTLGAAFVMGGPLEMGTLRLELPAGSVPVTLSREGPRVTFGWMLPPRPRPIELQDGKAVLAALGVSETALDVAAFDVAAHDVAAHGSAAHRQEHVVIRLPSASAVAEVAPHQTALAAATRALVSAFHFDGSRVKARVFAPPDGVVEAAALGAAASPIATHLQRSGLLGDRRELVIEQALGLDRPSKAHVRLTPAPDGPGASSIEVGGGAFIVARGQFTLPEPSGAAGSEGS